MPPVGRVDITAADAVGSAPITTIELPDDGGKPLAADWQNVAAMALANDAYVRAITTDLGNDKVNVAGDTMTGALILNAGGTVASGQELTMDGAAIVGDVAFNVYGSVWMAGRKRGRARKTLSDADQTVDVTDGDRFTLTAANAAPRTITLDNTIYVPEAGETLTFFWNPGTSGGGGTQYTFERDDSTAVATFVGAQVADTGAVFAEFEYALISTGPDVYGWKLGKHSGTPNEYTSGPDTWTSYGVVPGAGA